MSHTIPILNVVERLSKNWASLKKPCDFFIADEPTNLKLQQNGKQFPLCDLSYPRPPYCKLKIHSYLKLTMSSSF
jgi:hypothetical protein